MRNNHFVEDQEYLLKQNVLGIDNFVDLERAEQFVFTVRALEVELGRYKIQHFNLKSLMALHHYLFQDLYRFAGKIRDVQMIKGSTRFCQMQFITSESDRIFQEFSMEPDWETIEEAACRLAYYKSELNMIHPFREGNGRTLRIFIYALAKSRGFVWDYSELDRDEYMKAMIQSAYDTSVLELLIKRSLKKIT